MKAPQHRQGQRGRKKRGGLGDGSTWGFGSQDILDIGRGDWRMIGTQKAAWHEDVLMLPKQSGHSEGLRPEGMKRCIGKQPVQPFLTPR